MEKKLKIKEEKFNIYKDKLNDLKFFLKDFPNEKDFIEAKGKEIYNLKIEILEFVNNIDKKRKKIKLIIYKYRNKIKDLNNFLFYDTEDYKIKISEVEEKLGKNFVIYDKLKEENKPTILVTQKIKDLQKEKKKIEKNISKSKKANKEEIQLEIEEIKQNIEERLKDNESLKSKIKKYVNLAEQCDDLLTTDSSAIENEYSFIIEKLNAYYGSKQSLFDINIKIPKNKVISIIGPSGCGKSTFLKMLNRINDEVPNFKYDGRILLDGEYDITKLSSIKNKYDKIELTELRSRVGMIFQQPNPFPTSVFSNVVFGPRVNGEKNKFALSKIAEKSLKDAALWDNVKDNLNILGTSLSGGQQQRLCIARAIANKPEILLMDEPTSALDPISSSKIENLIIKLKKNYTIIVVTHSMQQAARISDYTAFFYNGKLIEFGETKVVFSNPKNKKTEDYIRGRFG